MMIVDQKQPLADETSKENMAQTRQSLVGCDRFNKGDSMAPIEIDSIIMGAEAAEGDGTARASQRQPAKPLAMRLKNIVQTLIIGKKGEYWAGEREGRSGAPLEFVIYGLCFRAHHSTALSSVRKLLRLGQDVVSRSCLSLHHYAK